MKLKNTAQLLAATMLVLGLLTIAPSASAETCLPPQISLVCAQAFASGSSESVSNCAGGTATPGFTCFGAGASGKHWSLAVGYLLGDVSLTVAGTTVGSGVCTAPLLNPGYCESSFSTNWWVPNAWLGNTACIVAVATTQSALTVSDTYNAQC